MCGRPQTPKNIKQTHMSPVIDFLFCAPPNFEICCRPHTGIACESVERISNKKSTHTGAKKGKMMLKFLKAQKQLTKH